MRKFVGASPNFNHNEEIFMKFFLALTVMATAVVLCAAGGASDVTFVDHAKVQAALDKGGSLVTASDYTVSCSHREKPGEVEIHEKETDVMHIIDGEATIVVGGTVVGGKTTKAGQIRGTSVNGGESRHLVKGDVVVVPAGVPHWFKEVPKSVSYYVVKVIK
jgi:mannose-6-phosphate isomerase-like protein (cupin superfamily)